VDAQPDVAKTRALALGDELAREATEQAPPWVRLALAAAYDKARRDAGQAFMTVAEMQAAQQQQQQAQPWPSSSRPRRARSSRGRRRRRRSRPRPGKATRAGRRRSSGRRDAGGGAERGAANGQMAGVI
jgi:hypothetical protein